MEDAGLRDKLALERTRLANERTFLAYLRTALSLLAAGVALLHFFPEDPLMTGAAWGLTIMGGVILLVGIYRFLQVRSHLAHTD
jgi:putative membrane protein